MEPLGIIGALVAALFAVAGYLAHRVIQHGERLAELMAHKTDTKERFDRQDEVLDSLRTMLDAVMRHFRVSSPPSSNTKG
jgi:hypothetical protein